MYVDISYHIPSVVVTVVKGMATSPYEEKYEISCDEAEDTMSIL